MLYLKYFFCQKKSVILLNLSTIYLLFIKYFQNMNIYLHLIYIYTIHNLNWTQTLITKYTKRSLSLICWRLKNSEPFIMKWQYSHNPSTSTPIMPIFKSNYSSTPIMSIFNSNYYYVLLQSQPNPIWSTPITQHLLLGYGRLLDNSLNLIAWGWWGYCDFIIKG